MSFSSLGLSAALLKSLEKNGYKTPYPIQEQVIPAVLAGRDVLGVAKTGSGKTASYVLPILQNLQKSTTKKDRNIDALIVVPTRELAVQVEDVFRQFGERSSNSVKSMAVYGGVSINPQMKSLYGVDVLIATPGRLLELVNSKAIQLSQVKTLVLDEADKMLNLGFKEEMDNIFSLLPSKRQTVTI